MTSPSAEHRSTVHDRDGFRYIASLVPLARPEGRFSLEITSLWANAKRPDAPRRVLQLDLDADGLRALRTLIDRALACER